MLMRHMVDTADEEVAVITQEEDGLMTSTAFGGQQLNQSLGTDASDRLDASEIEAVELCQD